MPEQQKKIVQALETLHQVRCVNELIQGVCSRMAVSELSAAEAQGLWVVLDWQNERVGNTEAIIKTMAQGEAANSETA